jgi:hypothetical protein
MPGHKQAVLLGDVAYLQWSASAEALEPPTVERGKQVFAKLVRVARTVELRMHTHTAHRSLYATSNPHHASVALPLCDISEFQQCDRRFGNPD